jgi:hypothetical protein
MARMVSYVANKIYDRAEIHAAAKTAGRAPGNDTSGITIVGGDLCIFWNPFRGLYVNRWIKEPEEFIYSGEGSVGDMRDWKGNRQLKERYADGTPVHVFYKVQRTGSRWLYLGDFMVVDIDNGVSRDTKKALRVDIRFHFRGDTQDVVPQILPSIPETPPPPPPSEEELWALVASQAAATSGERKRATRTSRNRRVSNPRLTAYVLQRAIDHGGACESCGVVQDWTDDFGRPHFQAHHIKPDVDLVDWIGAVCGTCHDRLHHGRDREEQAAKLRQTVRERQLSAGREVVEL